MSEPFAARGRGNSRCRRFDRWLAGAIPRGGFVFLLIGLLGCEPPTPDHAQPRQATADASTQGFEKARERMIEEQLIARNIDDSRVLRVMAEVPRHRFVPEDQQSQAYEDYPLPIGFGQTISQPYIVAFMTQILKPKTSDKVLEIGTGSGYQAAVLGKLVNKVYSIEIVPELAERAERTLEALEYDNVHVRAGDGYRGWPEEAPFDAVIVTCAPDRVPQPLIDQLGEGGRMIIPVGRAFGAQELILLEKQNGKLNRTSVLPVRFVPMTGGKDR